MGGDQAPEAIVHGAVRAHSSGVPVVLVGDEAEVRPLLPKGSRLAIVHASEVVAMTDGPVAVRRKEHSSLRVALAEVRDGRASAVVTCGNTGAALVGAVFDLGLFEGVERPPLATVLPRADGGQLVLLDAGANVDCRPEQLASFAVLGACFAEALGVDDPRIGLLSNGSEAGKGNMQVKATLPLLQELPLRVVGNVEPPAAFKGACDVLVCDGFAGNVLLKSVEGGAETVLALLKDEIRRHPSAQLGAWLLQRALGRFQRRVAWEAYGGGVLLGTRGLVVVGHGRSTAPAVEAAIQLAWRGASGGLVEAVRGRLAGRSGAPR